ncbi:8-oxo-dGTP diphosphatase [Microcoleus phage My-WqHQDG]|nr:8-oxo-dGTP diphosphatase [Microcoleus phage My-WqHQDG]
MTEVVGAIITNHQHQVLLVKRKADEDFMPSAWEIPGGKVEAGESLGQALMRKVLEETGINAEDHKYVSVCGYRNTTQYNYHVDLYIRYGYENPPITLTEHSEYAWVSCDDFETYLPPGNMILRVLEGWVLEYLDREEELRTEREAIAQACAWARTNKPALPNSNSNKTEADLEWF